MDNSRLEQLDYLAAYFCSNTLIYCIYWYTIWRNAARIALGLADAPPRQVRPARRQMDRGYRAVRDIRDGTSGACRKF